MDWQQFMSLGDVVTKYTALHDLSDAEQTAFELISNFAADLMIAVHAEDLTWFRELLNNAH